MQIFYLFRAEKRYVERLLPRFLKKNASTQDFLRKGSFLPGLTPRNEPSIYAANRSGRYPGQYPEFVFPLYLEPGREDPELSCPTSVSPGLVIS